jgi:hypothetical protein
MVGRAIAHNPNLAWTASGGPLCALHLWAILPIVFICVHELARTSARPQ